MRTLAISLVIALAASLQVAAQTTPAAPTCIGDSEALLVTGTGSRGQTFLIVDLNLSNRTSGPIRIDPARITVETDAGAKVAPMSVNEAKGAIRNVGAYVGAAFLGPIGIVLTAASAVRLNREIDARILRAGELPSGQPMSRSLYVNVPDKPVSRVTVMIDGLTGTSGQLLPPILLRCGVRTLGMTEADQPPQPPASTITVRTVSPWAQATAGPISVAVSVVEFWPDFTSVDVTLTNNSDAEADVFSALANATLTDQSGKTVAVRLIKSQYPERIPARGTANARLGFEALASPPQTTAATLIIPGIQVGRNAHEVRVSIRLQF